MRNVERPIYLDYVNQETKKKFHLPIAVFKKPCDQQEYDFLVNILDALLDEVRDDETHPLALAVQIIGDNIEDYDDRCHTPIGHDVTDIELISYIMKEKNLHQKDLVDLFGNQGNVSKFLNGDRKLSKNQIAKIVERFDISADFFFKSTTKAIN